MRFDRVALIEVIDEIEAARKAAYESAQKPRAEAWDKAVQDYKTNRAPKLTAQLRELADKTRRGQIMDSDELKRALGVSGYNSDKNYQGFVYPTDPAPSDRYSRTMTAKPTPTPYQPDKQLAALRNLLVKATTDDHVTTSVLRELGFSPSLFIKAAS